MCFVLAFRLSKPHKGHTVYGKWGSAVRLRNKRAQSKGLGNKRKYNLIVLFIFNLFIYIYSRFLAEICKIQTVFELI